MRAEKILAHHRGSIEALCQKYAVRRLCLFGSALREDWDPDRSDFDFLAEFGPPAGMSLAAQYFDFWEELKTLLQRDVDLVERCAIRNPIFLRNIERQERLLYAA